MRLVRNFLSLAGAEIVSKVVTFAAFAYLARFVGPEGFGHLEYAGTALFCATLLVEQGFGPYGAREIARAPQETTRLVGEIVWTRVLLALLSYGCIIGWALVLNRQPVTKLLLLYGASLLATPLLLQWVFQGHDRMVVVAVAQVLRQSVFAFVVFAGVRNAERLWLAAVAEIAAVGIAAGYCVWMYGREFDGLTKIRARFSGRLFREGVPIGLSQLFWVVRIFGGTLILGSLASASEVGFFAGALRIMVAAHTFVWLYYFNLLPSLSRAWQQDHAAFAGLVRQSFHGVIWLAAAGGLLWAVLAPPAVTLVYGAAFAPAGLTLQLLAGVCVAAALSGHYRFGLIAAGRQTNEMLVSVWGALVAVIAIPVGYRWLGLPGAAAGLLAAEIAVWLAAWWAGRRLLRLTRHSLLLWRPLLAVAGTTALLWHWASWGLVGRALLAFGALSALALLLDGELRERARLLLATLYARSQRGSLEAA